MKIIIFGIVILACLSNTEAFFMNLFGHSIQKRAVEDSYVCNTNECVQGTCEVQTPYFYGCHCNTGYTGINCDRSNSTVNPCLQNPCYGRGSTCQPTGTTTFTCTCADSSLTGSLCKSHSAASCQCQNGGVCVSSSFNGATVYDCTCPAGYAGNLCQYKLTAITCATSGFSCQNGGACNIRNRCNCPANYIGVFCNINTLTTTSTTSTLPTTRNPCLGVTCNNGGVCQVISTNLAQCVCKTGYYGINCDLVVPSTTTSTTSTSTTSTTSTTTSTTSTTSTTTSTTSTTSTTTSTSTTSTTTSTTSTTTTSTTTTSTTSTTTSTTSSTTTTIGTLTCPAGVPNPCLNGGICVYNMSGLFCSCKKSFSGPFCASQVAFCSVSPCYATGTVKCNQDANALTGTCQCQTGYSGTYCESATCPISNCNNNGICTTLYGVQSCFCFAGFTGSTCNVKQ